MRLRSKESESKVLWLHRACICAIVSFAISFALLLLPIRSSAANAAKSPATTATGILPSSESFVVSLDTTIWRMRPLIAPVYEERFFEEEELPDLWESFDKNGKVDAYKTSISDITDTTIIDLRGYAHPWFGKVTSNFGMRRWRMHNGIDLKLYKGDSVRCAFDGIVRISKSMRGGYGRYIVIRHFNGLETIYGHLSKLIAKVGDTLRAGEILGLGGNTGRSTGSHLHFELRYLGLPLNPNDLIDFETGKIKNSFYSLCAASFQYKIDAEKNLAKYWKVKKGDTLGRIAMKTGVSVSRLCRLNKIKKTKILRIGERIKLME